MRYNIHMWITLLCEQYYATEPYPQNQLDWQRHKLFTATALKLKAIADK